MTKLRTLKDIGVCTRCDEDGNPIPIKKCDCDYCKIRKEAIKHYKAVKGGNLVIDVPTYIRWANNLTEEDLK
jgi:hypothetical protein